MKKHLILSALILCCTWLSAFGWGKVGHDAVAYIAECNLTPTAKANIEKYLGGRSIVYYASWMDRIRATKAYKHTSGWHTFSVNDEGNYSPKPTGDAVTAIIEQMELLKNYKSMPDSAVAVGIKLLVHFIGDMHCPVHIAYPDVNKSFSFTLNGVTLPWHKFWDGFSLEGNHRWYYTDYQYQLDRFSAAERKELAKGTPVDWANDVSRNCRCIYSWVEPDQVLHKAQSAAFMLKVEDLADMQIVKAGYRLAKALNELFDN